MEEELQISTTGNQNQEQELPKDDFDCENHYTPSTQSTPNIIGNAGAIHEE